MSWWGINVIKCIYIYLYNTLLISIWLNAVMSRVDVIFLERYFMEAIVQVQTNPILVVP